MVLRKELWNPQIYSAKSHIGWRERLVVNNGLSFSSFLGCREFPP